MAGFRDEDDIDDVLAPKEPQVTSLDPSERKAARFLRIKRRQEAIKRAEAPPEEALAFEEPGAIELATTFAAEELQRLSLEGAAKVTNVKVTTDEREVVRRRLLADKTERSLKKIEEEAMEAQTQYEIITGNWEAMMAIRDPLDIDYAMKEQKQKCDDLLNQKNLLIDELKADLRKMDDDYYTDLQKQDNDIKELSDRVEKQITIMLRAYEKQIMLIEAAINLEREAMLDHNNKRWEALFKQRDKEELIQMELRFDQEEEHKQEIESIMWDHFNKYRQAKIELEELTQELQKELEKLKATCIINTEKIGYNYQVLKKREEENVFVRSQQKRKLNKMSDVANMLRTKIRKAAEDGAIEEKKADAEIVKLIQTMEDLEKKSDQFSQVNHYKFSQVWRMAATHLQETSRDIRLGEIALHAHVLSEPPPPPPPPPPKSPLAKYEHEAEQQSTEEIVLKVPAGKETSEAKDKLVRHILQLVADNTGFLVEDRLLRLISKYQTTSRNLCTLDAIFMALEIQAEDDVELLCKTFLNYAFCPICIGMETTSETAVGSNMDQSGTPGGEGDDMRRASMYSRSRGDRMSIRGRASIVARSVSASTSRSHVGYRGELSDADQQLITEAEEIIQKVGDPQASRFVMTSTTDATVSKKSARGVTLTEQQDNVETEQKVTNPFLCPAGHNLEIEAMQVLTALGEFIKMFVPPEKRKLYDLLDSVKPPNFSTPSRKMSSLEIEQYWTQWKNVFPPEKDKFWDGLLTGLNNYLPILQERERLHEEVMHLRQRNAALRRLVRGALPDISPALTVPKYVREPHQAFLASFPDNAPEGYKLPPI